MEQGELWVTPVRHGGLSLAGGLGAGGVMTERTDGMPLTRGFVRSDETARMAELGPGLPSSAPRT